jgi:hypothetical protein
MKLRFIQRLLFYIQQEKLILNDIACCSVIAILSLYLNNFIKISVHWLGQFWLAEMALFMLAPT